MPKESWKNGVRSEALGLAFWVRSSSPLIGDSVAPRIRPRSCAGSNATRPSSKSEYGPTKDIFRLPGE